MIHLQFAYSAGFGSALIKYFGHGAGWSHVDAILADGNLLGARHDVFGGIPAGVQIRPPNYKKFDPTQRIYLPAPAGETKQFYDFLNLWFPFKLATPLNKIDLDDLYLAISAREAIA